MKKLPIGNDQFDQIRQKDNYYVDKTSMIGEFLDYQDSVSLITRPRRFGKTLNMTMLREFFDITKDSRPLFEGLAVMKSAYASQINTRPVLFFSFKDCTGSTIEELEKNMQRSLMPEFQRYENAIEASVDVHRANKIRYRTLYEKIIHDEAKLLDMMDALDVLMTAVASVYQRPVILLLDEYDQPVLSSYEYAYHKELQEFFATFYGTALKGNAHLDQALLTGIQRMVKESIFSKLNNIMVYTVLDRQYASQFGLTTEETETLLKYYGLKLTPEVKGMYDGYEMGGMELYNPWSILSYVNKGKLEPYWVNTSTNYLIRHALKTADSGFREKFEELIEKQSVIVGINLETSFLELQDEYVLWGLFVNSGYLKIVETLSDDNQLVRVKIPNGEVKSEFQKLVADYINVPSQSLSLMFRYLIMGEMEEFQSIYSRIVLNCTSFYDAKENAYHMLFLGMCISLDSIYEISSNLEQGTGRSDIMLKAKDTKYPHIIIEFKQGKNPDRLKQIALKQILERQYDSSLQGQILCMGIAHNKKECAIASEVIYR